MGRRDVARTVEETLAALDVRREGNLWVGQMPSNMWGPVVFGGFVVAHAIWAATREAPDGRRIHSLHAYFLRPVRGGQLISYRVESLREGRSMAARRIDAEQEGRRVTNMMCSFAADTDGYDYQVTQTEGLPDPDEIPADRIGPWIIAALGATAPESDGTRRSTHRMWFRSAEPLSEDPHLHAALVGFATDITY